MAAKVYFGDLAAATFGGGSQLDYIDSCRMTLGNRTDEAAALTSKGKRAQTVKRFGSLVFSMMSNQGSNSRVSNVDISSVSIDGTEYEVQCKGGRIRFEVANAEASAAQDLWEWPQPLENSRDWSGSVRLMVPAASATANAMRDLAVQQSSASAEDSQMALIVVINSVTFTIPIEVESLELSLQRDDLQIYELSFKGRAPFSGAYQPPGSGTTSLVEKAVNQCATALSATFTPHDDAGYGTSWAIDMVIESFEFGFEDAQVIHNEFNYRIQGRPVPTLTS